MTAPADGYGEDAAGFGLDELLRTMAAHGVSDVYAKALSPNDNWKNQIYVGPGFSGLSIFPHDGIVQCPPQAVRRRESFCAAVKFYWLTPDGQTALAPHAQFVLYPRYPEVRLSGLLRGAAWSPADVIKSRDEGRALLLGVRRDGSILAYAAAPGSRVAAELAATAATAPVVGVFHQLAVARPTATVDWRSELLRGLRRLHDAGWLPGTRLKATGQRVPCNNSNCGGYTLEAAMDVVTNAKSEPDFHGWELKAHNVPRPGYVASGVITLMTPEPTLGVYGVDGFMAFMEQFGYADRRGRANRRNFGGVYRVGELGHPLTGMRMVLDGFNEHTGAFRPDASLSLLTPSDEVALGFPLVQLVDHWSRKHAQASYVPYVQRAGTGREFMYDSVVRLGIGTDGGRFLRAVACGSVYYDPGQKVEGVDQPHPRGKRRSQLRVASRDVPRLYENMEVVNLLAQEGP